jgi:hypothetical protein
MVLPFPCKVNYILHTFALETLRPHIVVISPNSNTNVSAMYVES